MNAVVYYCWLCGSPVENVGAYGGGHADRHYETGRVVYFCGAEHYAEYAWLRAL